MTAIAKGCIQPLLTWLNLQKVQNFFYHDRDMHSRRCTSFLNYFFYRICIFLWLMLFIFFTKLSWMRTFITNASLVLSIFISSILIFLFHNIPLFFTVPAELIQPILPLPFQTDYPVFPIPSEKVHYNQTDH